jgi:hypothetical protein
MPSRRYLIAFQEWLEQAAGVSVLVKLAPEL